MQLTNHPTQVTASSPLRAALALATASLLAPGLAHGQASNAARAETGAAPRAGNVAWQIDSAVLVYSEAGGRVRAVEPVINLTRRDGNDRSMGLKLTLDSLTGASPNGAAPQPAPQTFTSPSGNSTYTVDAGKTPLDPSFKDTRIALAFSAEQPFGTAQRLNWGLNFSTEYDFTSAGVSAALARDFADKNTTVSLGLALEADRIRPVGGAPVGLRPAFGTLSERQSNGSRNVADVLLGLTQVMSRSWITQVNLGLGRGSGDHTDPYKILSVVDGTTGLVTGDRYASEQRPDSRTRLSLYWQNKLHLDRGDVIDVSYRYYRDDWGLRAHTLDARYRLELPGGWHVEPRARLYRQSEADFWRGWLVEGRDWSSSTHRANVTDASADPRLGAFDAQTIGVKIGLPQGPASEWSLRLESYRQKARQPAGAPGVLNTFDVVPGTRATMLLLSYGRKF